MKRKERLTLDAAEAVEPLKAVKSVEILAGVARADVMSPVTGPVLDGIPRQPGAASARSAEQGQECEGREEPVPAPPVRSPLPRPWRLLPTPARTPFTFFYASVLVVTSLVAEYADPVLVYALHQGSSTDVAHLVRAPALVLFASALWVAGGVASPYALGFLLALTALERRIGGWRTAGIFLLGHVLATLATEVPVGFAVLSGSLPDSSLHRLDYGISFGVAASVGALAGLLTPWLRWPMLLGFGGMLVDDLIAFTDPMTNWGHLLSLAIGVATWPVVRHWRRAGRGHHDRRVAGPSASGGRGLDARHLRASGRRSGARLRGRGVRRPGPYACPCDLGPHDSVLRAANTPPRAVDRPQRTPRPSGNIPRLRCIESA